MVQLQVINFSSFSWCQSEFRDLFSVVVYLGPVHTLALVSIWLSGDKLNLNELILAKNWLNVKWFMFVFIYVNDKKEKKTESINQLYNQKLWILTYS